MLRIRSTVLAILALLAGVDAARAYQPANFPPAVPDVSVYVRQSDLAAEQSRAQQAESAASSTATAAQSAAQAAQTVSTAAQALAATVQSAVAALQVALTSAQAAASTAQSNAASAGQQAAAALAAIPPSDYLGSYTLATLPSAASSSGKRVLVTDLGGGPGYLRATAGCWKRVSTTTASVQQVAVSATATIDGLSTSPIVQFAGTFSSKATVTITNGCSMPQLTIVIPSGVLTATGSLGLVTSGSALSVAGLGVSAVWGDYAVSSDGSTLTKIRGGSL